MVDLDPDGGAEPHRLGETEQVLFVRSGTLHGRIEGSASPPGLGSGSTFPTVRSSASNQRTRCAS
ncbi:hypothetical protein ACU4GD_33740 [Cupriavidus basilensis]